jgi:hypothetical protein
MRAVAAAVIVDPRLMEVNKWEFTLTTTGMLYSSYVALDGTNRSNIDWMQNLASAKSTMRCQVILPPKTPRDIMINARIRFEPENDWIVENLMNNRRPQRRLWMPVDGTGSSICLDGVKWSYSMRTRNSSGLILHIEYHSACAVPSC